MTQISNIIRPNIIEDLSYEEIFSSMKDELKTKDESFDALIDSDPAIKILQVMAFRELLLRQRINNAAKANLLAYATNNDLDLLAEFYGVDRLENEDDEALRKRTKEKILGWSVAGSSAHYRYHALSSDIRVKDVKADSPQGGLVRISVLSDENLEKTSDELLSIVKDKVSADDVKVLTDTIEVVPCKMVPIEIEAKVKFSSFMDENFIEDIKAKFTDSFNKTRSLGWDLNISWINANLFLNGVENIEIISPKADIKMDENSCVFLADLKIIKMD